MVKIILSAEQAKAAELYKQEGKTIEDFIRYDHVWRSEFSPLKSLNVDDIARVLYEPDSFEVEVPKPKIGQWVTRITTANSITLGKAHYKKGHTFKIEGWIDDKLLDGANNYHLMSSVRLSNPEEIFWGKLDRDFQELKFNDVLMLENGEVHRLHTNSQKKEFVKMLSVFDFVGFYPASSFIRFPVGENE